MHHHHRSSFQIFYRQTFSSSTFSTLTDANLELSYMHNIGTRPLRYANIGQVLNETANKFPDRFSLISCMEGKRITFAETLDKVSQ